MRTRSDHIVSVAAAVAAAVLCAVSLSCTSMHVHGLLLHSSADWPMAGKSAAGSNADPSQHLRLPLEVLWECDLSAGTGPGAAIVVDSLLLYGTLQGEIAGVNLVDGKEFGSKKISVPISGAPLSSGNELYFCTEAGKETVFDYNLRSAEFVWKKNIGGIAASPILVHSLIIAGTLDGVLYALRASDGEPQWKFRCAAPIQATACADDSLTYCADTRGTVCALRTVSGTLVWKQLLPGAVYAGLSVVRGIVYAGSRDHHLYALDAATGKIRWTYDAGDRIMASVSASDSLVVVSALNGAVSALTHDGRLLWKFSGRGAINTPALITEDLLFVASLDTYIYALSLSNGSVMWKHSLDARIKTAPIVWNGSLIVFSDNKTIYRFASK